MRTTLTIADETDQRIRRIARDQHRRYKDVINDALAIGAEQLDVAEARPAYSVQPIDAGIAQEIDRAKLNQLVDELEAER
ncbi:MAG: hypothetical protein ACLFP4_05995 [Spirochaetales bacterium]